MNTHHVTTRSTIRFSTLATGLVLLFAGVTACGSEDGSQLVASSTRQAPSSTALIEKSVRLAAEERIRLDHEAARTHRFGDDRRTERHRSGRPEPRNMSFRPGYEKAGRY
jgi:hypothetical protein